MTEKYTLFNLNQHLVDAQRNIDLARANLVRFRLSLEHVEDIPVAIRITLTQKSEAIRSILYADDVIVKRSGDGSAIDIRAMMHDLAKAIVEKS